MPSNTQPKLCLSDLHSALLAATAVVTTLTDMIHISPRPNGFVIAVTAAPYRNHHYCYYDLRLAEVVLLCYLISCQVMLSYVMLCYVMTFASRERRSSNLS